MTTKFEVGRSYSTRSLCDYDCIYTFEILARTPKTVTIKWHDKIVRRKIRLFLDSDVECIDPHGRYSMSPVLRATD